MANEPKAGGQATPDPAAAAPPAEPKKDAAAPAAAPAKGEDGKGTPPPAKADEGKGGEAAAGTGGKDGAAPPKPEAPAAIELAIPDGAEAFIGDEIMTEITDAAKAGGGSAEQAQAALEEIADKAAAKAERYRQETVNDPVYGGSNLEQTQQLAERTLDRMWPKGSAEAKELRQILTSTGMGNRRVVIGALANIGKLMSEDAPPGSGKAGGAATRDAADVLYGQQAKPS